MGIFEQIKEQLNIEEVYTFYTGQPVNYVHKALCSFHADHKPSMSFKDGKIFNCFVCGERGDVFTLVGKLFGIKGFEAARKLNEDFRLGVIEENSRMDRITRMRIAKRQAEIARKRKELLRKEAARRREYDRLGRLEKMYYRLLVASLPRGPVDDAYRESDLPSLYFDAAAGIQETEAAFETLETLI